MGAQKESGLTLEAVVRRLETLERENAELRSKVATLEGSGTRTNRPAETNRLVSLGDGERASGFEGRVSRRSLLSKAGVAAAGLVVAGALTQRDIREAQAAQVIGDSDQDRRGGVEGTNTAAFGYGVWGTAEGTGVRGDSSEGYGVVGVSKGDVGVLGLSSTNRPGVEGAGGKGAYGEGFGEAPGGAQGTIGVHGDGATGVWSRSTSTNFSGVYGTHEDTVGNGVTGDGKGSANAGVLGRNPQGPGVEGRESVYGGKFAGSRAQLRLVPAGARGKPVGAHAKGEVYMDAAANLYVCVRSGTPGTWRRFSTVAV